MSNFPTRLNLWRKGLVNRPKGVLLVICGRGWIDVTKIHEFALNVSKANQMDEDQTILTQFWRFGLLHLMPQCGRL